MSDIPIQQEAAIHKNCIRCNEAISIESRFCKHCGVAQNDYDIIESEQKWPNIKQVALFFAFDAIICAVGSFIDFFKTLGWSIAFDAMLAIVAITFFCDRWSKNKYLLVWRNFSPLKLLFYCATAIVGSLIISVLIGWLNQALFSEEFSYYAFYATNAYGKELMIFFVAVMPALFEELAYRGFVLEKLLQVVDKKQALFISAFLFAIMHMSFISLFWLIPFALYLAYVRLKENTLWYGVSMHFCFNLTACLMELYKLNH